MTVGSTTTTLGSIAWERLGAAPGPPIVLLHANPGDRRDFAAVAPVLAETHTVVAVDWPGYGASPAPTNPAATTAMAYAAALAELAVALTWQGALLIGNSVGGYAAVRLALAAPERVGALVLVDPGGFTAHGPLSTAFCALKGSEWITRAIAGRFARTTLRGRNPVTQAMIARAVAGRRDPARVAVEAAIWRSFTHPDHDLRPIAAGLRQPTLLVWGKHDPVLPPHRDGRAARAAIGHARYVELDTGHSPFAESPEAFLAAVQPFLADVAQARAERPRP
jgi:pimeloyl-ACP methyl ester carboxylesterase